MTFVSKCVLLTKAQRSVKEVDKVLETNAFQNKGRLSIKKLNAENTAFEDINKS